MATLFADGFDMYGSQTDIYTPIGPWTSTNFPFGIASPGNTQFGTGQCTAQVGTTVTCGVTFATSEGTIYGSVRMRAANPATNSNYIALTFTDAGTAQCAIRFVQDGSISLYTGAATGTLIQSYPGIFTNNVWASFQFKIVFHNTAGSIEIRLNGSPTNAITKTAIATRTTANNTANGITFNYGSTTSNNWNVDDLFFNNASGNLPTSWPGDLRAVQQVPNTTTQSTFSCVPTNGTGSQVLVAPATSVGRPVNNATYRAFTLTPGGTVSAVTIQMNINFTGNVKAAIYDSSNGGLPGIPLTSASVTNPTTSPTTMTFSPSVALVSGQTYFISFNQDGSATYFGQTISGTYSGTTTFASYPATNPSSLSGPSTTGMPPATLTIITDNSAGVQELIEDGDTTYIFSSSTGEDKYSLSPVLTGYNVVMVQPYMMYRRSDVGPRTLALSLAANGSADTPVITDNVVGNLAYNYKFAQLELDPTGAAWTPTSVNGAIMGITGG